MMPSLMSPRAGTVRHVRLHHRARMEGGDLVVVAVGHDHRLRGVACPSTARTNSVLDAQRAQALAGSSAPSLPTAAIGSGSPPSSLQAVGDVAGAAAELAPQRRHQERHVQDVQLVRQDLLGEAAREGHDGVEGERSADHGCHGISSRIEEGVERRCGGSGIEDLDRVAGDAQSPRGAEQHGCRPAARRRPAAAAPARRSRAGASTRRATSWSLRVGEASARSQGIASGSAPRLRSVTAEAVGVAAAARVKRGALDRDVVDPARRARCVQPSSRAQRVQQRPQRRASAPPARSRNWQRDLHEPAAPASSSAPASQRERAPGPRASAPALGAARTKSASRRRRLVAVGRSTRTSRRLGRTASRPARRGAARSRGGASAARCGRRAAGRLAPASSVGALGRRSAVGAAASAVEPRVERQLATRASARSSVGRVVGRRRPARSARRRRAERDRRRPARRWRRRVGRRRLRSRAAGGARQRVRRWRAATASSRRGASRSQVEQALERVEDLVAAAAAHPAFGDLELVLHDLEDRAAGGAARDQAHARRS